MDTDPKFGRGAAGEIFGGVALRNNLSSRKKFVVLGTTVVALAVASHTASATPATLGFYPATDIYGPGAFHFDGDVYGRGVRGDVSVSTGLTYGLGDRDGVFGRSEFGFDYFLSAGGGQPIGLSGNRLSGSKRLLFNAKTQLYNNSESTVRVVGGVWGVGAKDFAAPNVGYITASKTFGFGRVHLGVANNFAGSVGGARVTNLGGDNTKAHITAGYDRYITPKLQFAVDYYTGKNSYAGVQPTLYYYVNDKANFGLGLFRLNSSNAAIRNQVYVCFDYNFGGKSAPAPEVNSTPTPETAPGAPPASN